MTYERAGSKPNRTLVNNTTIYGYDLRIIDEAISADTTVNTLLNKFDGRNNPSYNDSHVGRVVDFLKSIDMVRTPEARLIQPINRTELSYDDPSFEARFLNAVQSQKHPRDHLIRLFEAAIDSVVGTEDPRLVTIEQLITDANRNLQYDISWNEEKIRMWSRLMDSMGAISMIDEGIILSPRRGLIAEFLHGFQKSHESSELRDALDWIDENFIPTYENRKSRTVIHPGLACVLENMETDGIIEFRGMTDASNEVELPKGSSSSIDSRSIKTFSINDTPEESIYSLPMDSVKRGSQS